MQKNLKDSGVKRGPVRRAGKGGPSWAEGRGCGVEGGRCCRRGQAGRRRVIAVARTKQMAAVYKTDVATEHQAGRLRRLR